MRQLVDHFENRLFELATTLMMLGLSVHIALWPDAIGASAFHKLLEVLNEACLGMGPLVLRNGPGTLSTDKLKALITK